MLSFSERLVKDCFYSVVMNDVHDVKCIFLHVVINLSYKIRIP